MFVALLVTTCLSLTDPASCSQHRVADTTSNPSLDSIQSCFGAIGQSLVAQYLEAHPEDGKLKGMLCQIGGNTPPPPTNT